MDFRNKYLLITIRIIFGLLLIFSGVSGFLAGPNMQGIPEPMLEYTRVLWATGLFQMIKATEIIAGLMLVIGFLPALAVIFAAPIGVGVIIFNLMVSPQYIFAGVLLCAFLAYFGYAYWDKYKMLFKR